MRKVHERTFWHLLVIVAIPYVIYMFKINYLLQHSEECDSI